MFQCADRSAKQEGHVVTRPPRLRPQQGDENAGGDSDARRHTPSTSNNAVGESVADNGFSAAPPAAEREATEKRGDLCCISVDFICRHHVAPRGQLYVPSGPSFPTPLKSVDARQTAQLNVLSEKIIDDSRNAPFSRNIG